ncbi:MAG: UDP-N-acetylmuramate dehydrogenase [Actinomycetes bacterium]
MSGSRPAYVVEGEPLDAFTTVRTGGPAEYFARCGSSQQLVELLAWADAEDLTIQMLGSGSNLLVADEGVAGLVVKLDKQLAEISVEGTELHCGAGARLPAVAAAAARAGLSGIEFGVSIPGTVGGAVRMNANAYGGELAKTLLWAEVVSADGSERRTPDSLGFGYRSSNIAEGEVVARACFALSEADSEAVKESLAALRSKRLESQPSGVRTFGSTFKNPTAPEAEGRTAGQLLDEAGCRDLQIGAAGLSPKHANFVVNHGGASTADVLAVMVEAQRRVRERFSVELEPEVQTLGDVKFPEGWSGWTA